MTRPRNVFVFANQKGGVTKSTSSANLAAALSMSGKKILFVDTDPQAVGSSILGFQPYENDNFFSTYDLITHNSSIRNTNDLILTTPVGNLFLIPSSPDLYNVDAELGGKYTAACFIEKAMNVYDLRENYDYIILDTPSNLGIMTYSALAASDKVIIPIVPDKYAIEGMTQLQKAIVDVKDSLNTNLELFGILLAKIIGNESMSKRIMKKTKEYFGTKVVLKTYIRKNVTAERTNVVNRPVVYYNPRSNVAKDYVKLANEVLARDEKR